MYRKVHIKERLYELYLLTRKIADANYDLLGPDALLAPEPSAAYRRRTRELLVRTSDKCHSYAYFLRIFAIYAASFCGNRNFCAPTGVKGDIYELLPPLTMAICVFRSFYF